MWRRSRGLDGALILELELLDLIVELVNERVQVGERPLHVEDEVARARRAPRWARCRSPCT